MRAHAVVIGPPGVENLAGVGQRREHRLVQALVAQPAYETLRAGVLLRLVRRDVVPGHAAHLGPLQDRHAGQLRAVVGDTALGAAAPSNHRIQFARNPRTRERCVGDQSQALAREVVHDRQELCRRSVARTL